MIRVNWQETTHEVQRIVLDRDVRDTLAGSFLSLIAEAGIELTDDHQQPRRGDFWLGCQPEAGWGSHAAEVAWASRQELPVALASLRELARKQTPIAGGRSSPAAIEIDDFVVLNAL